jgi:serine/threonine protein kinase
VHRDIKPSNLFLTRRPDGSPLVKVLDFGISKAPVDGPGVLTRTDTVMGTPGYMSPEQMKASKDVDARSDIWALGIVLYECLHGRRPFDAETVSATVLRAATEPPPPMDPGRSRLGGNDPLELLSRTAALCQANAVAAPITRTEARDLGRALGRL